MRYFHHHIQFFLSKVVKIIFKFFIVKIGEPQEECARCGKTFLMPPTSNGEVLSGLCGDCSGDVDDVGEEDSAASADGDVDVDINDQD